MNALPDLSVGLNLNRRIKLKNGQEIGSITNVSFSNSFKRFVYSRNAGNLENNGDIYGLAFRSAFKFSDETFTQSIRQNVMQNLTYAPSKKKQVRFKNSMDRKHSIH
jgi:hypothetical protein